MSGTRATPRRVRAAAPAGLGVGIDFGTSNSAVAALDAQGLARAVPLEAQAAGSGWHDTLPTALFFNAEGHSTHFGRDALAQYLAGTEGRLMRSLKSLLGSSLLQEQTAVHHELLSFEDIITRFLRELLARTERQLGQVPTRAVLGRPVHFVDDDPARDRQAQDALEQAARRAGLSEVRFQLEPIAAALDHEQRLTRESHVLVVDIGGGTSDFTLVRLGPERLARAERSQDVLATSGVHLGGTDFDQRLNLALVMPLLGLGHTGEGGREVPSRVFHDLATWHLIHWCHTARAVREAQALRSNYRDRRLHDRLMRVLQEQQGHRIAHDVEAAKIQTSQSGLDSTLALDCAEPGLRATLGPAALAEHLHERLGRIVACARECQRRAGLATAQIDALYLTGGSSALSPLQDALRHAFAGVPLVEGDLFGGVAAGLAYGTRQPA